MKTRCRLFVGIKAIYPESTHRVIGWAPVDDFDAFCFALAWCHEKGYALAVTNLGDLQQRDRHGMRVVRA